MNKAFLERELTGKKVPQSVKSIISNTDRVKNILDRYSDVKGKYMTYALTKANEGDQFGVMLLMERNPPPSSTEVYDYVKRIWDRDHPNKVEKKKLLTKDYKIGKQVEEGLSGKGKKPNAWLEHVKQIKSKHPSKSLKEILKTASATYQKS